MPRTYTDFNYQLAEYMFGLIVNNMHNLKTLSFVPNVISSRYNIEDSLPALSQLQNLTKLYINGAQFTTRVFTLVTDGLGLEELVLARCDYDDSRGLLQMIARDLTALKSLGLTIRYQVNHDVSKDFKALEYHQSLKSVSFVHAGGCVLYSDLYKNFEETQESVDKLFDTLMTLPKLEEINGLGCIHMRNDYLKHIIAKRPNIQIRCLTEDISEVLHFVCRYPRRF